MRKKILVLLMSILAITKIQSAAIQEFKQKRLNENDLVEALRKGDITLLKDCLDQQVNVNASYMTYGRTIFMCAAENCRAGLVRMLLEYRQDDPVNCVNVNTVDECRVNALMEAAQFGHAEVVKMLLEYRQDDPVNRVNVNAVNIYGMTALMIAAQNGHAEVVRMLLEYRQDDLEDRINVNAADSDGHTALMHAAKYGHANVIKTFAAYNKRNCINMIYGNMVNNDGLTALMLAIKNRNQKAVAALMFPFKEDQQERCEETDYGYYQSREEQEKGCWDSIDVNFGKRIP